MTRLELTLLTNRQFETCVANTASQLIKVLSSMY